MPSAQRRLPEAELILARRNLRAAAAERSAAVERTVTREERKVNIAQRRGPEGFWFKDEAAAQRQLAVVQGNVAVGERKMIAKETVVAGPQTAVVRCRAKCC